MSKLISKYAVKFTTKAAPRASVEEGTECWLHNEYWVGATGCAHIYPSKLKVFESVKDVETFMKKWVGHPWYYKPKDWEAFKVRPNMVQQGYIPDE